MNPNRIPSSFCGSVGLTSVTAISLFILLTIGQFAHTQQHDTSYNSQSSVPDEEIIIAPGRDYEGTSADNSKPSQTVHDNKISSPGIGADNRLSAAGQPYDRNDPFAVTFDDYFRESRQRLNHQGSVGLNDSSFSATAIPDTAGLIIEDEENTIKQNESPIIDYIFPPSKQETSHHKQDAKSSHNMQLDNERSSDASELLDEIRLLFAWKQILTNKCSRTCGKGLRLNHLYCIDLKYKVRVEDDLCIKSKVPKPGETSDEPCNEIDCPPQWVSTEFQECSSYSVQGKCRPNLYKRVQCTMVNKDGVTLTLDDSKCSSTNNLTTTHEPVISARSNETEENHQNQVTDTDVVEFNIDYKNDIILNIDSNDSSDQSSLDNNRPTRIYPNNEPFFEPGNWSECSGASCGELGKRTRKLSCRIYLSRSSKFAELRESSCHGATAPETQEPCYMDCISEISSNSKNIKDMSNYTVGENADETVYDLEMSRFIWRKEGWTKCSADCLGGQRESIIECWDKVAQTLVDQSLCMEDLKPEIVTETCNEIPCPPEWRVEAFSKCTKSCGSAGIRTRSIACIQRFPLKDFSTLVVSNDLCIQSNGSMPHQLEPCNRIDCKPEWKVGPWSDCSKKCGDGVKNRTVICVQEFAHKDGPRQESEQKHPHKVPNPDLLEALAISSKDWHPGKATQVGFHECYQEYKTIPALDERCFNFCDKEPYIDADLNQDYRMTQEALKRKTILLRIGGKAQLLEGRNLKIRCKILNHHVRNDLVRKVADQIEWRIDGVKIFTNGSTVADKQYIAEDNLILGGDVFSDDKNQFMADEPSYRRTTRPATTHTQAKRRNLNVRSWNNYQSQYIGSQGGFQFVSQTGGRFSLIRDNTLRIKRLRTDDSGLYSCSYGSLSESLELKVVSRRDLSDTEDKLANNLSM